MKEKKTGKIASWLGRNFKFLQNELISDKIGDRGPRLKCGCNNMISSSTRINQLESYFCHYWPNQCRNSRQKPLDDPNQDINCNSLSCENLNNKEEIADCDDSIEEDEINSSSLVLIIPITKEKSHQRKEKKYCKVYHVPSLKSPSLVLTMLR